MKGGPMTQVTETLLSAELHEPEPRFLLPDITGSHLVPPSEFGIPDNLAPVAIKRYDVSDPYLNRIPPTRLAELRASEAKASARAEGRRLQGKWQRVPGTAYVDENGDIYQKNRIQWGDPVASEEFFGSDATGQGSAALRAWRSLAPRPTALEYLSDPANAAVVVDRAGRAIPTTPEDREWLAVTTDAGGVRSRGAILGEQFADFVRWHSWVHPKEPIRIMSVACGTALPTAQGAVHAGISNATLSLLDGDRRSMGRARELAEAVGFTGRIVATVGDVFNRQTMAQLKEELTAGGVDRRSHIVDAMGIFEYTGAELRSPDANDPDSLRYDPAGFLKAVYDLVQPGGRLVLGQMRDDRPNADFTMGVVGWPYICMRSPKEVMEIIVAAGIDPEMVTLSLTPEGLYTVATVDKPAERVQPAGMSVANRDRWSVLNTVRAGVEAGLSTMRRRVARVRQAVASLAMNVF
jgi:SAM-dependent methyltransferase